MRARPTGRGGWEGARTQGFRGGTRMVETGQALRAASPRGWIFDLGGLIAGVKTPAYLHLLRREGARTQGFAALRPGLFSRSPLPESLRRRDGRADAGFQEWDVTHGVIAEEDSGLFAFADVWASWSPTLWPEKTRRRFFDSATLRSE